MKTPIAELSVQADDGRRPADTGLQGFASGAQSVLALLGPVLHPTHAQLASYDCVVDILLTRLRRKTLLQFVGCMEMD